MRPFSAFYFIKENKTRCMLLMLMIFLSFGVYLGGIYITNPYDNWETWIGYYDRLVAVEATDLDEYNEAFVEYKKEAVDSGKVDVIAVGQPNGMDWDNIMGARSGQCSITFRSVDDFKLYCSHMDITCDFENLKSGSMIMSERFAKNRGLKLGDTVDKEYDEDIYEEFTLDALTKEDGYTLYFITNEEDIIGRAMLLGKSMEGDALYDFAYELRNQLDNKEEVEVYSSIEKKLSRQLKTFHVIYIFVVVFLSVILAVTINAAFVGMYQHRKFEFAVYKAIGISKKRIVGKITGELLLMELISFCVGALIFFGGLYLFNNIVLYPAGKYLRYFHPIAFWNLILCNVIVIVPLVLTRSRQMLKVDICDY